MGVTFCLGHCCVDKSTMRRGTIHTLNRWTFKKTKQFLCSSIIKPTRGGCDRLFCVLAMIFYLNQFVKNLTLLLVNRRDEDKQIYCNNETGICWAGNMQTKRQRCLSLWMCSVVMSAFSYHPEFRSKASQQLCRWRLGIFSLEILWWLGLWSHWHYEETE